MTVIHHYFGAASAAPAIPEVPRSAVSDGHSSGAPNCAREIADRAHRWIEEAMILRHGLTPQERRDLAHRHTEQVRWLLDDHQSPLCMSVAGRHAWTARILVAED